MTTALDHLPRRSLIGLGLAATGGLVLAACADSDDAPSVGGGSTGSDSSEDKQADYDALILAGPVADEAAVSGNQWASKIKDAGVLNRGGTSTSPIFSFLDPTTNRYFGFDAGIGDLLAHYILGGDDASALSKLTETTVDTRETMLENNSVDTVIATYSITPERAAKINYAGPYYSSGAAIMVKADNTDIKSVADLEGKKLATESNSTGITAIEENVKNPDGEPTLFQENATAVQAVEQGSVDAYVLDQSILLSTATQNKNVKVVGEPFTQDPYGIGLNKDGDAKDFVNEFLQTIYDDGTWAKLWDLAIGAYIEGDAPTPPEIGSVEGS